MKTCGVQFHFWTSLLLLAATTTSLNAADLKIAIFEADVTIPLGHRCMGVLPQKSVQVLDPLEANGFVLLSGDKPVVFVAVDWCEIRNGAYDRWRDVLAESAGTTRERVLVTSLHQHDAPVTDAGAAEILRDLNLANELYDEEFHEQAVQRVATALRESLKDARPVTHVGTGQALVRDIASNRRVVHADGSVHFDRGSRSGADPFHSQAPEGLIDPWVKTLSFWNQDEPLLALSVYATHPMSSYGRGEISADFVGLARRARQEDLPGVKQIYASGCSGDITAGKFNDGSAASREGLIQRLREGMATAWQETKTSPVDRIAFRVTSLELPFYDHAELTREHLETVAQDPAQRTEDRILAAMGLSSRNRVAAGELIDVPCVELGPARLVLLPGESFVGYQLMAQSLAPDAFVVTVGYGECWPGYIPTNAAFADHFHDKWLWVAPGSEEKMQQALKRVLAP